MAILSATAPLDSLTHVRCDLCGSASNRLVLRKRGVLIQNVFSIVRCEDCGLVYVNPRIRDEDIAKLYDDQYYIGQGFDRTTNYAEGASTTLLDGVVDTLLTLPGGVNGKYCLDVGCGNGELVQRLRNEGAIASGSETATAAKVLCEKRGIPLVDLESEGARLKESFDIITATEVIEHVPSPTEFLCSIASYVKPGGIIFLTTGNWSLVSKIPGTPYVMPEGHLQYFTPVTLTKLFLKANLVPVFEPLNRTWFVARSLKAASRGAAPPKLSQDLARMVRRLAPTCGPFPLAIKPRHQ